MVTEALAGPSAMSGSDCGLATSAALCAIASEISRSGEKPASRPSPVSDRAAVKARRVMIKVCSRMARSRPKEVQKEAFASLKRQLWQWRVAAARRVQQAQFRLIEAPSRASAARNSSSSTADRVSATFATAFGSGARRRRRPVPARQRRLPQRQPADRAPAEEAVDPLQDHVGGMLDLQRHRPLDPQHQRRRFLRLPLHRPRPLHLQRLGMGGDLAARRSRPSASPVRARQTPAWHRRRKTRR